MDKRILALGSICVVLLLVSTSFVSAVNTVTNVEKTIGNKNEKQSNSILERIQVFIDGPILLLVGKEYTFTFSYRVFYGFEALFEVDWGDGTTPYRARHAEGKDFYLKHTYNKTGKYTIKATASYPNHPDGPYGESSYFVRVVTELQYPIWAILFTIIGIIGGIFLITGGIFVLLILLLLGVIS